MEPRKFIFTSESVTEGHPDKICDRISDSILDEFLKLDPDSRVAVETMTTTGVVIVAGEVTSKNKLDIQDIVRNEIIDIGYDKPEYGFDGSTCSVLVSLHEQSPDISIGVTSNHEREQGAGDQGLMFGFAINETSELMPLPITLAHNLSMRLSQVRKKKELDWVRPDGKSQVSVIYEDNQPKAIDTIVLSTQHSPEISQDQLTEDLKKIVISPVCEEWITPETKVFVNPTGRFVIGGPPGDTGLTGRKIIADTYGGMGRHGGGAFSGKDPTKVDRSACYMARYISKNIVAADLATKCEVQIAYAIGVAKPVSIMVDTFRTAKVPEEKIEAKVREIFDTSPAGIIKTLDLKRPIYKKTSAYGHFGRRDPDFKWEQTDKVDSLGNI
ncbi:MAG: methionine adenosyltransferase [Candidatus Nitrosocosmicus sp.]|jgi:S-adenosylmethionine synthetase|uniref:methionine adenosyltransferase n=1 Tax=Candidatus Nitrosocosmicus agrestis TaxID=2563600 RepID=UPI00122E3B26|nr:methionine adenosyltransferase [Candidatus Nitrosocosmicus sp. SS]KAA2281931.1 methionine adenosyltransferase [Candidatus Nitrosocosmicus sp. SS]KAF0869835.1 methionine adenosyltransferase [Candidatus Nitrosocosmicus sp. SS]MDR4490621.1 methionine adenosyltransferase [Candidatus Nitrosocosmicus sp.]HET6589922.1 methionine adenosyltransferase [Candidatus Nitrosocosmicus sp.]